MLTSEPVGDDLARGEDGVVRCAHRIDEGAFRAYHDQRFGRPSADDAWLFEKLVLEVFSSGLSFITVLRRREALRAAFEGYDLARVAAYGEADVQRVLAADGVVRNARKARAIVTNAARALDLVADAGSLSAFLWSHEPDPATRPERVTAAWLREHPSSPESTAMAAEMKARGFTLVGPVVAHGLMQGSGVVDDHLAGCEVGQGCRRERAAFDPPRRRSPPVGAQGR